MIVPAFERETAMSATTSAVMLQTGGPAISAEAASYLAGGLAALAVGLAALGSGFAERGIGAAAVGAIAEDPDMFGRGLILTVLPETLVILTLVTVFVVT
ncbi:ATP synthase subunit C [Haloarcula vallismortis ATCC 29715]|uniref:ATP synthase subunit C n=3 Tax=Haloarcula vallismortis TaxID=28442 RepID=M0IZE7_HALVA|nr:ATP synthase subunit C [Haloarcula vallismortis ATCC 29715]